MSDPSKNQPIASLSPFSKILKRVIYDQLVKYFDEDPVIFKNQPGLRKSHSTEQAIMEITDNLKASIDRNVISCGFFLDFSKAFHTIQIIKYCETNSINMVSVVSRVIGLQVISKIASNFFKLGMKSQVY